MHVHNKLGRYTYTLLGVVFVGSSTLTLPRTIVVVKFVCFFICIKYDIFILYADTYCYGEGRWLNEKQAGKYLIEPLSNEMFLRAVNTR